MSLERRKQESGGVRETGVRGEAGCMEKKMWLKELGLRTGGDTAGTALCYGAKYF